MLGMGLVSGVFRVQVSTVLILLDTVAAAVCLGIGQILD
jgi:hypothetical protein